jgi:hypothetical protein
MQAWAQSRAYHVRPSEVLRIRVPLVAYAVDTVVAMWGNALEGALRKASEGKKDQKAVEAAQARVLRRWLPSQARYADPAKR